MTTLKTLFVVKDPTIDHVLENAVKVEAAKVVLKRKDGPIYTRSLKDYLLARTRVP